MNRHGMDAGVSRRGQAELDKCRSANDELTSRAAQLERDLETTTRMYEAEVRARRTDTAATLTLNTARSRPTSATDSAPLTAHPTSLQSPPSVAEL